MSNRIGKTQGKPELEEDEVLVDLNAAEEEEQEEEEQGGEQTEVEDEAKSETKDEFELPEKFKGKTVADIVQSYENLEREYGRRNNEVGQLRKLTDQLLELERPKKKEEADEETKLDADSLLENPADVIQREVENNPTLKAIQEKLTSADRATAKAAFENAHPDFEKVFGSPKFAEWILKSDIRKNMFIEADKNYDYATGAALLTEFKELYPSQENTDENAGGEDKGQLEEDAKAVTTEKKSKSRPSSRKIYSRAQIIELAVNNPEEYARRQDEFRKAYEEKRVR